MPLVTLALATVAVLLSMAVALASIRAWRDSAAEAEARRLEAKELASRLEAAERLAGQAAARAEVTGQLLLEKGIADEDDLETVRDLVEASGADDPPAMRGGQTVH
jgi:hypothetical protein